MLSYASSDLWQEFMSVISRQYFCQSYAIISQN